MKYKLFITFFVCFSCLFFCQNYKLVYNMQYKKDSTQKNLMQKNMVLLLQNEKSIFLSEEKLKKDSVKKNTISDTFDYDFMVLSNKKTEKTKKFISILKDIYSVEEPYKYFDWHITSEKRKIYNYDVQKAILKHSNRVWEAWFTPDIIINEGPYIFKGLPGLIVEIKDTRDNYIFELISISKNENIDLEMYIPKNISITKKQLRTLKLNYYLDPYNESRLGKIRTRWIDDSGREFKPDYRELTLLEQKNIKRNNNPIELSDIIVYPN